MRGRAKPLVSSFRSSLALAFSLSLRQQGRFQGNDPWPCSAISGIDGPAVVPDADGSLVAPVGSSAPALLEVDQEPELFDFGSLPAGFDTEDWEWVIDDDDEEDDQEEPSTAMTAGDELSLLASALDLSHAANMAGESFDFVLTKTSTGHKGLTVATGGSLLSKPVMEDEEDEVLVEASVSWQPGTLFKGMKDIAYNWLCELGVSEAGMERIVNQHPGLLSCSTSSLRAKAKFLADLGITRHELREMVGLHPWFMTISLEQNMKPTLAWFHWQGGLELDQASICHVLRGAPALLTLSVPYNLAHKREFFRGPAGLNLSALQFRKLIVGSPMVLCLSLSKNIIPTINWLEEQLGMSTKALATLIVAHPHILSCSVEKNLSPKMELLKDQLGMTKKQCRDIFKRCPAFFGYSLNRKITPCLRLLRVLGLSTYHLRLIVKRHPKIFGTSLLTVRDRIRYLKIIFELNDSEVGRMIVACPALVGMKLRSRVEDLRVVLQGDAGLSKMEMRKVVLGMPSLLACSVQANLKPKMALLLAGYGSRKEVRASIVAAPSLLGYSAEGRIGPRMIDLTESGLGLGELYKAVQKTDQAYETWLQNRLSKRKE
ncbi:unnamed protein product [Chrysoparadoxa australica]